MPVFTQKAKTTRGRQSCQNLQDSECEPDAQFQSLVDVLSGHAAARGFATAYVHWSPNREVHPQVSFLQLHQKAQAIASVLQQRLPRGARVILAFPTGIEFIASFMACLYAGVIAVPVYPPFAKKEWPRFARITQDCGASLICTTAQRIGHMREGCRQYSFLEHLPCLAVDELDSNQRSAWRKPLIQRDDIAFLQYTSGTTGDPKGVMVSHGNIMANQAMITDIFRHSTDSIIAGWLPMYHDMGLIGTVLNPLYVGCKSILMEPIVFLRHPYRWLKVISDYRATTSGAPNFAYDYCTNRITAKEKSTLDLSSWNNAFNGAEKVQINTIRNFSRYFRECGFRRDSFLPCYGLAEATLFASGKPSGQPVKVFNMDKNKLALHRIDTAASDKEAIAVTSCGIKTNSKIRIVDPETCCSSSNVGEIWLAGPHIAKGYYGKQRATEQIFNAYVAGTDDGPYLRTGDLGFIKDDELYVAGRIKEMIIIRGKNYYPQDVELIAQTGNSALRSGAGAAFSIESDGEEKLILVQEINKKYLRQLNAEFVYANVRADLISALNLDTHEIVLVKQGALPLTSSGKIRRKLVKQNYLDNNISAVVARELNGGVTEKCCA